MKKHCLHSECLPKLPHNNLQQKLFSDIANLISKYLYSYCFSEHQCVAIGCFCEYNRQAQINSGLVYS